MTYRASERPVYAALTFRRMRERLIRQLDYKIQGIIPVSQDHIDDIAKWVEIKYHEEYGA